MTDPQPQSAPVAFWAPRRLRLIRADPPRVAPEHQRAADRIWGEMARANPTGLFDGPAVACTSLDWDDPHHVVLSWAPVTYRHYALRRVPGASALSSLFVAVLQPADDGRLLVGRMSSWTAAPGRWQLPGGSAEPPADHERLDEAALRRHAARELAEETGVDTAPHELRLWAVTRGRRGSTGVYFRAPARPASVLAERFMAAVAAETALGREPEFAETALVRSPADLGTLPGSHADYLEIVLRRYAHRPDDWPERA
ncbi:NUDIX hydrolase [Streptomyces mordarskii]|uniref:Nudix hydrolase domain-containing protein n=1 Tax=Streptomyces mordarskii TaxID=1226758 RepID=A0ABP3P4E6_9ACTN